jgi:DNA repair protein RadC
METTVSTIRKWPTGLNARKKMYENRVDALTNAELLSLLIGPGNEKCNALGLARNVLSKCKGDLQELGKYSMRDLMRLKGIGQAKASSIVACLEIGRRRQVREALESPVIDTTEAAVRFLKPLLADYNYEVFGVMFLDASLSLIKFEIISRGGLTATTVDPRIILKIAIDYNATSIIVSHNHPSGNESPSRADKLLTTKIDEGTKYMNIKLLDHIIIADTDYYSFAKNGQLSVEEIT